MGVKLSTESIRYIALFESLTGANIKDCLVYDDKIVFLVRKGDMGVAIGKGGINVEKAREIIGKRVEILEHSDDPEEFLTNLFKPVKVRVNIINKDDRKIAYVQAPAQYKGLIIGKGGKNINKVKELVRRHHDIDDVIVK